MERKYPLHKFVDDIIFGSTHKILLNEFITLVEKEFEMGMLGKLKFLSKQKREYIFTNPNILRNYKRFRMKIQLQQMLD